MVAPEATSPTTVKTPATRPTKAKTPTAKRPTAKTPTTKPTKPTKPTKAGKTAKTKSGKSGKVTSGEGLIESITTTVLKGGETSTTIQGKLGPPSKARRSGFEKFVQGSPGLHRAHLWTWRFGEEARPGIMNAPSTTNLSDQKRLENTIVNFAADSADKGRSPFMKVTGVSKPGQPTVFDHAEYSVWDVGADGSVHGFTVTVGADHRLTDAAWISEVP